MKKVFFLIVTIAAIVTVTFAEDKSANGEYQPQFKEIISDLINISDGLMDQNFEEINSSLDVSLVAIYDLVYEYETGIDSASYRTRLQEAILTIATSCKDISNKKQMFVEIYSQTFSKLVLVKTKADKLVLKIETELDSLSNQLSNLEIALESETDEISIIELNSNIQTIKTMIETNGSKKELALQLKQKTLKLEEAVAQLKLSMFSALFTLQSMSIQYNEIADFLAISEYMSSIDDIVFNNPFEGITEGLLDSFASISEIIDELTTIDSYL